MHRFIAGALLASALSACAAPEVQDQAADRTAVNEVIGRYAAFLRAMSGDSIAAMFTADGQMLDADRVVQGPAAIRAFLASFVGQVTVDSSAMTIEAMNVEGRLASIGGAFYQRYTPAGRPSGESRGRYSALLLRQPDGRWLIQRILTATAR